MTINKEADINREVILEIIKKTQLQSSFLYGTPIDLWPKRLYVKLSLFRRLVAEGKLECYHREEFKDRVWEFYAKVSTSA